MKAIVELKNATKVVTNGFNEERVILDKVNLTIYQGDFITILGGNGAGKSTLFNVIAGTLPLTSKILGSCLSRSENGNISSYDGGGKPAHRKIPWRGTGVGTT